jgi:hypothetical protein
MQTVTIQKNEYEMLTSHAKAYASILNMVEKRNAVIPPTKSKSAVLEKMKKTGKYSPEFLQSIKTGLKRSSHFTEK